MKLFLYGKDKTKNIILVIAVVEKSYKMVLLLLQYGVDINVINNDG